MCFSALYWQTLPCCQLPLSSSVIQICWYTLWSQRGVTVRRHYHLLPLQLCSSSSEGCAYLQSSSWFASSRSSDRDSSLARSAYVHGPLVRLSSCASSSLTATFEWSLLVYFIRFYRDFQTSCPLVCALSYRCTFWLFYHSLRWLLSCLSHTLR